jgi:hypothetical protein
MSKTGVPKSRPGTWLFASTGELRIPETTTKASTGSASARLASPVPSKSTASARHRKQASNMRTKMAGVEEATASRTIGMVIREVTTRRFKATTA